MPLQLHCCFSLCWGVTRERTVLYLQAQVTQIKSKSGKRFIGINAGMNSLIRPALYDAYHHIVNLTRFEDRPFGAQDGYFEVCVS